MAAPNPPAPNDVEVDGVENSPVVPAFDVLLNSVPAAEEVFEVPNPIPRPIIQQDKYLNITHPTNFIELLIIGMVHSFKGTGHYW